MKKTIGIAFVLTLAAVIAWSVWPKPHAWTTTKRASSVSHAPAAPPPSKAAPAASTPATSSKPLPAGDDNDGVRPEITPEEARLIDEADEAWFGFYRRCHPATTTLPGEGDSRAARLASTLARWEHERSVSYWDAEYVLDDVELARCAARYANAACDTLEEATWCRFRHGLNQAGERCRLWRYDCELGLVCNRSLEGDSGVGHAFNVAGMILDAAAGPGLLDDDPLREGHCVAAPMHAGNPCDERGQCGPELVCEKLGRREETRHCLDPRTTKRPAPGEPCLAGLCALGARCEGDRICHRLIDVGEGERCDWTRNEIAARKDDPIRLCRHAAVPLTCVGEDGSSTCTRFLTVGEPCSNSRCDGDGVCKNGVCARLPKQGEASVKPMELRFPRPFRLLFFGGDGWTGRPCAQDLSCIDSVCR